MTKIALILLLSVTYYGLRSQAVISEELIQSISGGGNPPAARAVASSKAVAS
jgi:hypothetical protein